jgi:cystathionine beta-lyase/cystathionine gamma-synthase
VSAIKENTKLLYLESPNTFFFDLQDLKACASLAKKYDLKTIVDNSYASPYFQNPAEFGIDIIVHSATKYINGHSDVVAGVICGSKTDIKKIFELEYMTLGTIIGPHDAALIIRGLRTLHLRLQRSHDTAMQILSFLKSHPKIEKVIYPFDEDFPQYELAKSQMRGAGGLLSFYIKADTIEKAEEFSNSLKAFQLAVSWGGHESLFLPMAAFYNIEDRENTTAPFNMIRIYVGLEDPQWLISDLDQALNMI